MGYKSKRNLLREHLQGGVDLFSILLLLCKIGWYLNIKALWAFRFDASMFDLVLDALLYLNLFLIIII